VYKCKNSKIYCVLCAVFISLFPLSLSAKTLEYLYINASEGSASGGHVALRFDNETFHFQHYDGGIIRIVKDLNSDFDYQYRYLENRRFYIANIELKEATYQQLYDHFIYLFFQQKQQNAYLHEINRNLAFFQQQLDSPLLAISAAGLLAISPDKVDQRQLSAGLKLHAAIDKQYAKDFVNKKLLELSRLLQNLSATSEWVNDSAVLDSNFINIPYSYASQAVDISSKILLLQNIQKLSPLNEESYFIPLDSSFDLSESEILQLKHFQGQLIQQLVELLNSNRPDWGKPGFVLYARILSLELSMQAGRFVFLNSYNANSVAIEEPEIRKYQDLLQAQKQSVLTYIQDEKVQLFAAEKGINEKSYSVFEMLSNYYFEREIGLHQFRKIRVSGEQRLPTKSIVFPKAMYPKLIKDERTKRVRALEVHKKEYLNKITRRYKYNVLSRNCVTEIFSELERAKVDDKQLKIISQLINKEIAPFIPFQSFSSLAEKYTVTEQDSFRQQRLAKMYASENNAQVFFREFNTLTARDYKLNDNDSAFIFFTDDAVWNRPFLGFGNLLFSSAYTLYGGLMAPFDAGKSFKKGGMGMVMSFPELAFFNIRKGSYQYLLPLNKPTAKEAVD